MSRKRIYLDYASTTPLDPRVFRAMVPFLKPSPHQPFALSGNPGSLHAEGVFAQAAVSKARESVARILQAHADEIIFTSGGTESNNLALQGAVKAAEKRKDKKRPHLIVSVIEHASVLDTCKALEKEGVQVSYIPVDRRGIVDVSSVIKSLRAETVLVSIMHANNEIGTIQPIAEIGKAIRAFRAKRGGGGKLKLFPLFHTDASQTFPFLAVSPNHLQVDLLTLDGQKIYGPKGIGILYKRRGVSLEPLFYGGKQELKMRPGTENVPAIVGFAKAFALAAQERVRESRRLTDLRDYFIKEVLRAVPTAHLNGDSVRRIANNINFSFVIKKDDVPVGISSERIVLELDQRWVAVGSKSACLSLEEGSYVVASLGGSKAYAGSSVRFTLGRWTRKKDLSYVARSLGRVYKTIVSQEIH